MKRILTLGPSSYKNLYTNPANISTENHDSVDAGCQKFTASWVRALAVENPNMPTCPPLESYRKGVSEAVSPLGCTFCMFKVTDAGRLRTEYSRLVDGLVQKGNLPISVTQFANPALLDDIPKEAMPRNIQRAKHFCCLFHCHPPKLQNMSRKSTSIVGLQSCRRRIHPCYGFLGCKAN